MYKTAGISSDLDPPYLLSILRRLLNAINHHYINRPLRRFQSQPELLLNGGKDRRSGSIRRWRRFGTAGCDGALSHLRSPLQLDIV